MPKETLSYSKVTTFGKCSAAYYYTYLNDPKLPKSENAGALIGGIVHSIAETIGIPNRRNYLIVSKILNNKKYPRSIKRLFEIKLKKHNLFTTDNLDKCLAYLKCYLSYDFWLLGHEKMLEPELEFNIKTDKLSIKGFLDRSALFRHEDGSLYVKIIDLKTQKQLFSEQEMANSTQALSYLLAVKTLYPELDLLKSTVDFIMVAHNKKQTFQIKDMQQYYDFIARMENYQSKIDSFTEENIKDNLAYNKGFLRDGTFGGILMCGKGVTRPGELKADGTPKYYCPYKFPFSFYVLVDDKGKIIERSNHKLEEKNGLTLERRYFSGCCAHNDVPLSNGKTEEDFL